MVQRDRAAHHGFVVVHVDDDVAALEAERMTERNQLVRALGGHHAGDDRRVEHRALAGGETGVAQRARDSGREAHP